MIAEGAASATHGAGKKTKVSGEQPVVVEIEALAAGGDGVAHLADGRVVFVDGGVPGDRIELVDLLDRRRFARARVGRVVRPSPRRVEPRCAHFGRCGGCRWQHVDYPTQLEAKRRILLDALERIGGLSELPEIDLVPSPSPYGYRARARVVEADSGVGFRVRGAHRVEAVEACPVLVAAAESAVQELSSARISARREPGPRRRRRAEWVVTAGSEGAAAIRSLQRTARSDDRGAVEIELLGERLRVSGESFVQGNALLWEALAQTVRSACLDDERGDAGGAKTLPGRFVELYAGIGFFTIPLARRGLEGLALESDRSALADLAYNLRKAGLAERVRVLAGRVESRGDLRQRLASGAVLLVDPPRIGLDETVRRAIADEGPGRVVYVSCDPATLARDLAPLVAAGYRPKALTLLDVFPQTPHVETVVRLVR